MANIFARKSTAALLQEASEADGGGGIRPLRRTLSALNLGSIRIGGIIGAGVFVLTGHAAARAALRMLRQRYCLGEISVPR